ncbi:MAG: hypothetical protein IMZ60_04015 [Actinobacteria bacterium]|nr:hypothetical protein [Chloroflexota bacterium]MBE3128826.1 hypothetical protein [Actinomycetota bacterium]
MKNTSKTEKVKISGKWTIPNTKFIDFSGDLYLEPTKNVINLITYTDKPFGLYKEFDVIIGKTIYGYEITLYQCFVARENTHIYSNGRMYNTTFTSNYCLYGVNFKSDNEVMFHEVVARFTYLDEWAFFESFDFGQNEGFSYSFNYKVPNEVIYKIDEQTTLILYADLKAPYSSNVDKEIDISQKVYVSIKHTNQQPLKVSLTIIDTLMDFIRFCTFNEINYIEIFGYNPNYYQMIGKTGEDKFYDTINIYKIGQVNEDYESDDPRDYLLNLKNIDNNFSLFFSNWFLKKELLKPVISLFLNATNPHLPIELQFLSLVQALESYHRRIRKKYLIDKSEHDIRIESILDNVPEEHREWLDGKLKYSNEPTLIERIDDLSHEGPDYWIFFNGKREREKFLKDVRNTRNYFVHYDKSLKSKALQGEDLVLACDCLRNIIEYNLLKEIGLSYETIRPKIVERTHRLRRLYEFKDAINKMEKLP